MKVLITGGAGFIGSHLVEHFQGKADVRVLDNLRTGRRENLMGFDVEYIDGDIRDRAAVARAVKGVDYVFHLAAMVSVPESMAKPRECVELNVNGLLNVLEESAAAQVRKLVFSSSSAVYGESPEQPKHEGLLPDPRSPYAITKLDGEYYCRMFRETGKLDTACFRYFNVFGPRQDPKSAYAAAVPIFAARALAGEPIDVFGDGEQTRDFVYVKDVVAANVFAAEHELPGVCNVARGHTVVIRELAEKIRAMTGSSSEIRFLPPRPGDIKHSSAAVDRLAAAGFRAAFDFDYGLSQTIEHLRR